MLNKISFVLLLFLAGTVSSQTFQVGFYNVENLFDTIDDKHKNDNEFLPDGKNQWTQARYNEKIKHINQVMDEMGNLLLLGMCEIENEAVVRDVVKFSKYAKSHGVVHYESPDERGIDVALIYDSLKLKKVASGKIRYTLPEHEKPSSRDILWSKFVIKKDTVFVMVNHWPSRRGGQEESEKNRVEVAKNARKFIDSLEKSNPKYKLIFMGDLNDYPEDIAPKMIAEKLTPMVCKTSGEFGGTYFYKNEWDVLDHIMVSPEARGKKGFKVIAGSGKILSPSFLIEEYKGKKQPFRTYGGSKYLGGYSDHLPVTIDVKF